MQVFSVNGDSTITLPQRDGLKLFQVVVSVGLLFAFFYIVVVSWSVWYLAASVGLRLEWAYCGHEYNTDDCYEIDANATVRTTGDAAAVGKSSVEQYWERYVLGSNGRDWDDFVSAFFGYYLELCISDYLATYLIIAARMGW